MQLGELSIEVTNECNKACLHCSSGSMPHRMHDELTLQEHLRLIQEAEQLGATVLSLSGGNPLLYSHIPQLVNEAIRLKYERILIYVTGDHRNGNTIDTYKDFGALAGHVTWIFSLHSHNYRTNDYIMNMPGTTKDVLYSILWLKMLGEEVEIHMVPMKPNYGDIPWIKALCEVMGIDKLSLLRFVPQTRGLKNDNVLGMSIKDFETMQHIMAREKQWGEVDVRLGCPIDFRHAVGLLPKKAGPCHAGDDLILVRPNGDAHPCAAWKSLPADINIRDQSLKDIWYTSEVFEAIRTFKADGYTTLLGCQGCVHLDTCMGGCPAQRMHAYGKTLDDLYSPYSDPLCPIGRHPDDS